MERRTIRLSQSMWDDLDELAEHYGVTRSEFMRDLLFWGIDVSSTHQEEKPADSSMYDLQQHLKSLDSSARVNQ